ALLSSPRPVLATSYTSHEHLAALTNLRSLRAAVTRAFPNGFRDVSGRAESMDLLYPPGPIAEALRDEYARGWGYKEATYASTNAMWWRYRIEVEGYDRYVTGARNSHAILFEGVEGGGEGRRGGGERGGETAAEMQRLMQQRACQTAELSSTPSRQAVIIRDIWLCDSPFP
ncbi:MAG: hypothetical protein SGPRY_010270, partial [Prymnesium sp.]